MNLCLLACNVNVHYRDTMDSVKQSAALCLLRLYKTSPDLVIMGEWTSRVVHLLNDQHMVRAPCKTEINVFKFYLKRNFYAFYGIFPVSLLAIM